LLTTVVIDTGAKFTAGGQFATGVLNNDIDGIFTANDTRTCDGWMSVIEKGVTTDVVDTSPQGGKRINEA
jgi:hypothetical protein